MENNAFLFPTMPADINKSIIQPSKPFIHQVYKSAGAVVLFIFVYLLLFLGSLAIALAFCLLGYAALTANLSSIGLLVGIGFIVSGLLLVFFVIKFLFRRTHTDYSDKFEITKEEHPKLFAFINRLTVEAGSPKPKRIFVTADVNAGVFYASTFWSMFFPVGKNLQIGLGLVNSVNISEFKAIMAHEFGHFSQRSMKFGSYVYNLNKVIYNMLFENHGYEKLLNKWARMHMIFRLMAYININIIKGMQEILKKTYVAVNKTYLGLAREMEFHADAVAAYVGGSNQAESSLKRVEIGQVCYANLLDYWNLRLGENKRSANLYAEHSEVIKLYASKHLLELDSIGLPLISYEYTITGNNLIEIDDPWSSHPLTIDREERLKNLDLKTETLNNSPWSLFENPDKLQKTLTNILYLNAQTGEKAEVVSLEEFKIDFYTLANKRLFDEIYKNYYDRHTIAPFDVDELAPIADKPATPGFMELYTDGNCKLPGILVNLQQNIYSLDQLITIRNDVKKFYYLNIKYNRDDATELQTTLTKKSNETLEQIKELDKSVFIFFYNVDKTNATRDQLINEYKRLFKYQEEAENDQNRYNEMMAAMKPVYSTMQANQIRDTMDNIYAKEKKVKPRIKEIINDDFIAQNISAKDMEAINNYLKNNWLYYMKPNYDSNAISIFNRAMQAYLSATSSAIFSAKKSLLAFQSQLLN